MQRMSCILQLFSESCVRAPIEADLLAIAAGLSGSISVTFHMPFEVDLAESKP